ncbi:hypothetical protein CH300_04105 [Rhodococcus sp. 15-1154-1]|nr:hypothetical protein CH300_04105 [Rhodococcus sp. 15-1154-1]
MIGLRMIGLRVIGLRWRPTRIVHLRVTLSVGLNIPVHPKLTVTVSSPHTVNKNVGHTSRNH